MKTRTNDELNRIIAEWHVGELYVIVKHGLYYRENACGYTGDLRDAWKVTLDAAKDHEYNPKGCVDPVTIKRAPALDYCQDLNAIHEAWLKLTFEQKMVWAEKVYHMVIDQETKMRWFEVLTLVSNISARQRAEALVKVIEQEKQKK